MQTTPLWVPLAVAALGVVGTLAAGVIAAVLTQRAADRRESTAWSRQQQQQRDVWAREDEARTFEQRRSAYTEFYYRLREMQRVAYDHGMGLTDKPRGDGLPEGWQTPTFRSLQAIKVYGAPPVLDAATDAYSAAWRWGHSTTWGRDDEDFYDRQDWADEAENEYVHVMRRDLGVPQASRDEAPEPPSDTD